ncbi:hypothetical protein Tco_0285611 [Tanacetum coccineum]
MIVCPEQKATVGTYGHAPFWWPKGLANLVLMAICQCSCLSVADMKGVVLKFEECCCKDKRDDLKERIAKLKYNYEILFKRFYPGIDEPLKNRRRKILDVTARGIFLYKSPNQAFQFLEDKVLFKHDWPIKSKNEHHQKSVSFADGSDSNDDNYRLMKKLEALTIKMDSQFQSLKEEMHEMRNKYQDLRDNHDPKNHLNDDTPMCERHEANYIQYKGFENQNSFDSFSRQSHYGPNNSKKSLTKLNNDVKNDLEDFKRRIRSMRTIHWKLFAKDDGKTTGVFPNKKSKTVNQEPQAKTDFEKSITKFLDDQRVTSMFFKNNVNDMILKIKQNEKNFQIKIKNIEIKIDEWLKSQNISLEQTDWTEAQPPTQAQTEQVNAVFTGSGRFDDSLKTQKDPPPPIIVDNKTEKDKPIKTSKKGYHVVKTNEYPYLIFMDTAYGRRWICRIGNCEYAFSCEELALIRYQAATDRQIQQTDRFSRDIRTEVDEEHIQTVDRFRQQIQIAEANIADSDAGQTYAKPDKRLGWHCIGFDVLKIDVWMSFKSIVEAVLDQQLNRIGVQYFWLMAYWEITWLDRFMS